MHVQLDLDLEKLTEFAFQMRDQDNKGTQKSNIGGWQSNNIYEEKHEEFEKLKKKINQYLQKYRSEVFRGMEFKENVILRVINIWVNINEKYHYNDWHNHPMSTLSGSYYIKHDGSKEHGDILFKHPIGPAINYGFLPPDLIKIPNEVTSESISIKPSSNSLLIFPSWLEHRVSDNLKDDVRISLSFNSVLTS
jgi:uncharacterized protein (TIGR02466 family)